MSYTKETDNKVVAHFHIWLRVLGGLLFLGGAGILFGKALYSLEDVILLVLFICVGLPILLFGIWLTGYTFALIFDHTLGNMTMRKGIWSLTYRTKRISKREVLRVSTRESKDEGPYATVTTCGVWLKVVGREKEMKIISAIDCNKADYIFQRIRTFIWGDHAESRNIDPLNPWELNT